MKIKTARVFAVVFALMGVAHIAATFHPMFAGKFACLPPEPRAEFTYISLVFGLFHVLCGVLLFFILPKVHEIVFTRRLYGTVMFALIIDAIVAPIFMRHDPSSTALICLLLPIAVLSYKK